MEEKRRERRRELRAFAGRAAAFGVLLSALLLLAAYVLTPKDDYGICPMTNLYRQPRDTVDVLALGTSVVYSGVNPNVLWRESGLAAYNLASAEQPFWVSYYALREALKTQHPRLLLLDAKPAIYTEPYTRRGRIIMSTYGIRSIENRWGAIRACVASDREALGYLLMYPALHSMYPEVGPGHFALPPDNGGRGADWKGFIEADAVERHSRPSLVWSGVHKPLQPREEEYFRKILALAREREIEVLLIAPPNPDYAADHLYMNTLWQIAAEYGVEGINYNHPDLRFGLRFSSDFADWQHLNVKGSIKLSRRLAEDIRVRFSLPDRRGDPAYLSYERAAENWYQKLGGFSSAGEEAQP